MKPVAADLLGLLQSELALSSQLLLCKSGLVSLALQPALACVQLRLEQAVLGGEGGHLLLLLEQQLLQLLQLTRQLHSLSPQSSRASLLAAAQQSCTSKMFCDLEQAVLGMRLAAC